MLATAAGPAFTGQRRRLVRRIRFRHGESALAYARGAGANAPPITDAKGGNAIFGYERGDEIVSFAFTIADVAQRTKDSEAARANSVTRNSKERFGSVAQR